MLKKMSLISCLIGFSVTSFASNAVILHQCETSEAVQKRADDEVCDFHVDASEDCFTELNKRFTMLERRPKTMAAKDFLTEAESVRETYNAAILTVGDYLKNMDKEACGDQRVKVEVMIDEMKQDLKATQKLISEKTKSKK